MSKIKLSVIICVYDTEEELLLECLRSITESTLFEICGEYEICIVDDGSCKDYSDIAKKYGARLKKTENQGIFAARQTGALMARGEFIVYCDSDDTVSCDYHLPMLKKAEDVGADIVIGDWANRTQNACYYPKGDEAVTQNFILMGKDKLRKYFQHEGRYHSFYVLWNKLYRTELLKSSFKNLRALGYERASYAEDAALNFFAFRNASLILNIHTGFYFYRIHPAQSVNVTSRIKLLSQIEDMTRAFTIMKMSLPKNEDEDILKARIHGWEQLMAITHLALAKSQGYDSLIPIIEEKYGINAQEAQKLGGRVKYGGNVLLPKNLSDIDKAILSIHKSKTPLAVKYDKKDAYTARCMRRLIASGKAIYQRKNPDLTVPKAILPLKARLIHNPFIYNLGNRLFKKGSKSRTFLKRFL